MISYQLKCHPWVTVFQREQYNHYKKVFYLKKVDVGDYVDALEAVVVIETDKVSYSHKVRSLSIFQQVFAE